MSKSKKNHKDGFDLQQEEALKNDLKHFGYLMPTNDEELEQFEQIYGTTQVIFPEHLKDPAFLFDRNNKADKVPGKKVQKEVLDKSSKKGNNDYFKKVVLAAEIAYELYQEPTFGHKKFVKIWYLCKEVCNMNLTSNHGKYVAGPLDPKLMYSVDAEFKKQGWFQTVKRENFGFRYEPLENVDKYKKYYERYYSHEAHQIASLIELFRTKKSAFCEVVATLYYVWKELIENKTIVNEATLKKGFYGWSKAKSKFSNDTLIESIAWMREHGITPG